VKARFQNVFDVGGFYVECHAEKTADDIPDTSDVTQPLEQDQALVVDNLETNKTQKQTRSRIAARTSRRISAALNSNRAALGD
jgi:hypothetical protein